MLQKNVYIKKLKLQLIFFCFQIDSIFSYYMNDTLDFIFIWKTKQKHIIQIEQFILHNSRI